MENNPVMFETTNQIVDLPIQNGVDFPYKSPKKPMVVP